MSAAPPPLSTADLGLFFEPRHHRLATDLAAMPVPDGREPGDLLLELGRRGVLRWLLPGEGGELDVRALCLIREHLAYASPVADALFAVQGLGAFPLWRAGRDRFSGLLERIASGEAVMAFALTEVEAGSDAAALRTRADPDAAGGYVLSGDKTLISNAAVATHLAVFATVDPDAGARGITAFLVPADSPGLAIAPTSVTVEHPIGDLALRGVRVPDSAVIGDAGGGLALAMQALERFRVAVGAAAAGMARRALDETVARVRGRRQFGKSLAEQPVVQAELAEMATDLDAARLLVLRAARELDEGALRSRAPGAMAKLFATEAAHRIVDRAVQLHGGLGVTRGHVVEHLYRAIRPLRIYEGTSEIQRLIIARELARN